MCLSRASSGFAQSYFENVVQQCGHGTPFPGPINFFRTPSKFGSNTEPLRPLDIALLRTGRVAVRGHRGPTLNALLLPRIVGPKNGLDFFCGLYTQNASRLERRCGKVRPRILGRFSFPDLEGCECTQVMQSARRPPRGLAPSLVYLRKRFKVPINPQRLRIHSRVRKASLQFQIASSRIAAAQATSMNPKNIAP